MENKKISSIKEFLISIRELLFILLFVVFLVYPSGIKDRFVAAGFTKVDFGFAEWEAEIEKSKQEVIDARIKANEAERHLNDVSSELSRLTTNPRMANSASFVNQVGQLKLQVDNSAKELRQFDSELDQSVQKHDQLIGRIKAAKTEN